MASQGRGRSVGGREMNRGPWNGKEDEMLREFVRRNGEGNWGAVHGCTGLRRGAKSCRLRWANHLRPSLKKGALSGDEERQIFQFHAIFGNRWSRIAAQLPGRTDNEIKNFWNTKLKQRSRASSRPSPSQKPTTVRRQKTARRANPRPPNRNFVGPSDPPPPPPQSRTMNSSSPFTGIGMGNPLTTLFPLEPAPLHAWPSLPPPPMPPSFTTNLLNQLGAPQLTGHPVGLGYGYGLRMSYPECGPSNTVGEIGAPNPVVLTDPVVNTELPSIQTTKLPADTFDEIDKWLEELLAEVETDKWLEGLLVEYEAGMADLEVAPPPKSQSSGTSSFSMNPVEELWIENSPAADDELQGLLDSFTLPMPLPDWYWATDDSLPLGESSAMASGSGASPLSTEDLAMLLD